MDLLNYELETLIERLDREEHELSYAKHCLNNRKSEYEQTLKMECTDIYKKRAKKALFVAELDVEEIEYNIHILQDKIKRLKGKI